MAKAKAESRPVVEELSFRSDSAYLCMLLNRRTRFIRIIDFRSGALPAKRVYLQSVAKQENIEKALTLVEKDEVSSWTKVGFVREGTIPGFYKRSDGHLCGCVINERASSIEVSDSGAKLAERTINAAKKAAKEIPDALKGFNVHEADEADALAARDRAWKRGTLLSTFDMFGRDAERLYMSFGPKRGKVNYISAEYQECFGHSLLEILRSPASDQEIRGTTAAIREMTEDLKGRGIVSAFTFAPSDDVSLGTAFAAAGFRKTGLLAKGVLVGDERRDAILWTRKLAHPGGEEDEEE